MADQAFNFWKEKDRTSQEPAPAPARPVVSSQTAQGPSGRRVPPPLPGYRPSHVANRAHSVDRRRLPLLDGSTRGGSNGGEGSSPTAREKSYVSQLAERLDLILVSPPPSAPPTTPKRRVSDMVVSPRIARRSHSDKAIRKISLDHEGKGKQSVQGKEGGRRGLDGSSGEWKLLRWRSFSGSKSRSVKIRSSGFICYLDGPEKGQCDGYGTVSKTTSLDLPPCAHEPTSVGVSQGRAQSLPPEDPPEKLQRRSAASSSPPPLSSSPPPQPMVSLFPKELSELARTSPGPTHCFLATCSPVAEETAGFWDMVSRIRSQCCPPSPSTPSHLHSPILSHHFKQPSSNSTALLSANGGDSLTVALETRQDVPPTILQCKANSTVREVISQGLRRCGSGWGNKSPDHYCLKVCGRDEYLEGSRQLHDYEYVYQCRKFSADVRLVLVENNCLATARESTASHDQVALPAPGPTLQQCVSQQELDSLLDSYLGKDVKLKEVLASQRGMVSPLGLSTLVQSVVSCVRLVCERLSFLEPPEVTEAVFNLRRACKTATHFEFETSLILSDEILSHSLRDKIWAGKARMEESPSLDGWVSVENGEVEEGTKDILSALDVLQSAVQGLVTLYCSAFQPGYRPVWWVGPSGSGSEDISTHLEQLKVKVCSLHRVPQKEFRRYDMFQLEACVYHGGRALSKWVYSPPSKMARGFFPTVVWDKWLNLGIPLSNLPREARLCFTLHGLELPGAGYRWNRQPVGWVALRLFSCKRALVSGPVLLGLWLGEGADPLDTAYSNLNSRGSVLLQIAFEEHQGLCFPEQPAARHQQPSHPPPPPNVLHALKLIAQKDRYSSLSPEEQQLVWANRIACPTHLGTYPRGLPVVLLSTPHWHPSTQVLADVEAVLGVWPRHDPTFGLELLDAQFPQSGIRSKAVEWLSQLHDDDLCDFLPQLVKSLCYDCYETSALAELLLSRAVGSIRIAHFLYWHLRLLCGDASFSEKFSRLLAALEALGGQALRVEFENQVELVDALCSVAEAVKASRDAQRQTTLVKELRRVAVAMVGQVCLPLDPALRVSGINIKGCSFFSSNTVPLRLSFRNADPFGANITTIFKVGDDLRQDILVLQLLRLFEKTWLRRGLDLKMVTYRCVATGADQGLLEFVSDAETLRAIQTQHGVTGSFRDKPLAEWLTRHNPTDSAYTQAVENFTLSCAGYCVATFVLGICDRHNDNIMVRKSGHLFHIDFGKILGNAQMFGNIRRDRAPFVLTKDMAYVINGGEKLGQRFQRFSELCCAAYNELRRHAHLIMSLLSLMLSSDMPGLSSSEDLHYVRDALLPGRTEDEAAFAFTKHIEDSLGSLATPLNFFIHNLAQMKFASSAGPNSSLLSFSPSAHSIATDGRITTATITTFHKRFYPETYYVYQIEVSRENPTLPSTTIFRRYREFDELGSKLAQSFPGELLPQLPGKIYLPGRSHTRQTSEKRQVELNSYLAALLATDQRIAESDIVYTFLHRLERDEQDTVRMEEEEGYLGAGVTVGRVRVELSYNSVQQVLSISVQQVRDLLPREGCDSADPYVKLYLLPDPDKNSKQKTRILHKTLAPRYQETFSYPLPEPTLPQHTLQLSVWDASSLWGRQCLGVALRPLNSELIGQPEWLELRSPGAR